MAAQVNHDFPAAAERNMGVDLLDFTFRIEKRFGIKVNRDDYHILDQWVLERRPDIKPHDLTAGELHDWVVKLCEARDVKVPHSSWNRVKFELAKVVAKSPRNIRRETFVVRDLEFS
jgi:hypothetical protein